MRKKSNDGRQLLRTVRNALALLEAFTPDRPDLGITEMSQLLRLSKTSAFRLASTLEAAGYLTCDGGTGRYALAVRLFELGCVAISRSGVREAAAPFLDRLARDSQETVHLAILDDGLVVYVDKIDGRQAITAHTRLGGRADAYCTATGKALLAFAPESTVDAVVRRGLRRHTATTVTDPAELRLQLDRVRRTGYAVNRAEWREGVAGVAAPAFDHKGQAVAAVGLAAPAARASTGQYQRWASLVLQAAADVSARLGCARKLPRRAEGILEWLPPERPAAARAGRGDRGMAATVEVDMAAPGLGRIVTDRSALDVIAHDLLFGEGPVWSAAEGALYWVDILGDAIWKWTPGIGRSLVMRPSGKANGMTFDGQGRRVVAGWASRSVWRVEPDGSIRTLVTHYGGKRINTPNDIVVRSDGSIYWTDPTGALFIPGMEGEDVQRYLDAHPVFRLDADGRTVSVVTDELPYPNGLAFSPDESTLYVADTRRAQVVAYPVGPDGGAAGPGRVFYQLVGDEPGVADGMKVDVEGNVYVTGPAGVHVVGPDGRLLGRIRIPGHTTNMAWGDADWRSLYVTTYSSVYRVRLGVPGLPVPAAGGTR